MPVWPTLASFGSRAIQRLGAAAAPESKRKTTLLNKQTSNPLKQRTLCESRYSVSLANCNSSAGTWNKAYHLCDITEGEFQNPYLLALCNAKQASDCRLISFTDRPETPARKA